MALQLILLYTYLLNKLICLQLYISQLFLFKKDSYTLKAYLLY